MMWETSKSRFSLMRHAWSKQFKDFEARTASSGFIKSPTRNSKQASGFSFLSVVLLHQWCFPDYFIFDATFFLRYL
jgi:hypothetical protein